MTLFINVIGHGINYGDKYKYKYETNNKLKFFNDKNV